MKEGSTKYILKIKDLIFCEKKNQNITCWPLEPECTNLADCIKRSTDNIFFQGLFYSYVAGVVEFGKGWSETMLEMSSPGSIITFVWK